MKLEMVFRIYRRLLRRSSDFCETVVIKSDGRIDSLQSPTEICVRFIPPKKRKLSSTERSILKHFCEYHKLKYTINRKGEMLWYQLKPIYTRGKGKNGKM